MARVSSAGTTDPGVAELVADARAVIVRHTEADGMCRGCIEQWARLAPYPCEQARSATAVIERLTPAGDRSRIDRVEEQMSTDEQKLPEVPATEVELNIRGLRSYVAQDGEDLVLVLQEDDPHGEGVAVTLEPGIGANTPEAIEAAERLGRTALHWAELMRVRAGARRPLQAS